MVLPSSLIDLERYPIEQEGPARDKILSQVRADLAKDGCAVIKGFLSAQGVETLRKQAESVAERGHRSFNRTNPYFTQDDPSLPSDDPRRQFYDRSNSFVPADNFPKGSALRNLYEYPQMTAFVKACLQEEDFYPYDDILWRM